MKITEAQSTNIRLVTYFYGGNQNVVEDAVLGLSSFELLTDSERLSPYLNQGDRAALQTIKENITAPVCIFSPEEAMSVLDNVIGKNMTQERLELYLNNILDSIRSLRQHPLMSLLDKALKGAFILFGVSVGVVALSTVASLFQNEPEKKMYPAPVPAVKPYEQLDKKTHPELNEIPETKLQRFIPEKKVQNKYTNQEP